MKFRLSNHAKQEMKNRFIPTKFLEEILENPQQAFPIPEGKKVFQSKIGFEQGKMYLVRVVVNDQVEPAVVVTVYRTSKIEKYWRRP